MKNNIILISLLIISGIFSGLFNSNNLSILNNSYLQYTSIVEIINFILSNIQGLFFGLALGIWSWIKYKTSIINLIIWLLLSVGAFFLAVTIAVLGIKGSNSDWTPFITAGFAGSLVVSIAYRLITPNWSPVRIFFAVITGSLCGIPFLYTYGYGDTSIVAFTIWQLAVAIALAFEYKSPNIAYKKSPTLPAQSN